jgi:gluconokinase
MAGAERIVVMGVAASGKSRIGAALAATLPARYVDGDDLHPPANVAKMSRGEPLDDADRAPWLARVGQTLRDGPFPIVVSCSALKRNHRDAIRQAAEHEVLFLHLAGPREIVAARIRERQGHFMPASLLDSQYAALEPLGPDEPGFALNIDAPPDAIIAAALHRLGRLGTCA